MCPLLYCAETWTLLKADVNHLQAFHMRSLGRIYTDLAHCLRVSKQGAKIKIYEFISFQLKPGMEDKIAFHSLALRAFVA